MNGDTSLNALYLLMIMLLVVGSLAARRIPIGKMAKMAIAWVAIFGVGFVLFSFRDDISGVLQRLQSDVTGNSIADGTTIRIPKAEDGHFYVDGQLNGHKVRFLVDSGATMTTIGRKIAGEARVAVGDARDQMVMTGNGPIRVASASADSLDIATIHRTDVRLHVDDGDDLNVLGMNYLSSLKRWGVEGRWLVLEG